ncbi:HYR-like domain-containing protein, partial [Gelatiniphilus marinus]
MRKLYTNKTTTNRHYTTLVLFAVLLLTSIFSGYSQARVPFTPRAADATPSKTTYNIKGDFTMVGNTNLTLVNYSDGGANDDAMRYVDADNTIFPGNTFNTFNSSSATVTFSTENNAIPSCSNIIYAGLYWTGRTESGADDNADGDNDPNTFEVTKNGITKQFDKRQVRIKGPGASSYTTVTAGASGIIADPINIAYPTNGDERNMYAGYADITAYVKDPSTGGIGEYYVADIALREGNVDGTGYYGGWGMVIVYENSKMNWRDITVFDGHAYVNSGPFEHTISVSGFNAVSNGAVNVKLGLMAGEGDVDISGDYFEIERQIDGAYQRLSHAGNTTDNFFNSSITNPNRFPNNPNNTGLDIAMFNIDNTNNDVITNNQTSTVLRYGSTQDTYIIFNVTFAVDAYVPEPEGVLNITSVNGNPPSPPDILEPGQNSEYTIEIKNTGTEATDNTVITIPLPDTVNPSNLNITTTLPNPSIFTTTNTPSYQTGPGFGTNGSIVWDLGTLPNPTDPDTVLATISFRLTVTTDCTMLTDPNFNPDVSLSGTISGNGAVSNIPFSFPLIQGYQLDGLCVGEPIPTPVIIGIDYLDYVNQDPTASNPDPINVQCISDVPAPDVNVVTDEADNQGTPTVAFVSDVSDGNTCPETITRTYSVTDDCGNSINVTQTITVNDDTDPTVSGTIADTTVEGCSIADATTPANTVAGLEALGLTIADNCTSNTDLVVTNSDTASGTCPTVVNRTYTITDACGNSVTATQTINVNDTTAPTASNPAGITIPGGPAPAPDVEVVTDEADNCTANPTVAFVSDVSDNGTCPEIITRTYSVTDDCGNSMNVTQIISITDPIVPTASNPDPINVQCISDVPAPDVNVVTDEADNQGTPTVAFVSDVSDG